MNLERLLEAAKRLQDKAHPFVFITADATEHHVFDKNGYSVQHGAAKIVVRTPSIAVGTAGTEDVVVGNADVDLNGIVLSIRYDDKAPWWAVNPFIDAMEGK